MLIPGRTGRDRYVPDVVVAPKDAIVREAEWQPDAARAVLAGEITYGRTGRSDRGPKVRGHARAGIPAYLLVDRDAETARLYTEPEDGRYTRIVESRVPRALALPEPFGFDLDTSEF